VLPCLCGAPYLTRGRVCYLSFSVCSKLPVFTSSIYVTYVLQFSNLYTYNIGRVRFTLRLTASQPAASQPASQSACLGVEHTLWTFDQILYNTEHMHIRCVGCRVLTSRKHTHCVCSTMPNRLIMLAGPACHRLVAVHRFAISVKALSSAEACILSVRSRGGQC
jgi:hypothetical protein